jgi:hypothetical protein
MTWIVQLGFELDVYLPDELAGMYWYLSLLAQSQSSVLNLIVPHLLQTASRLRPNAARQVNITISYLETRIQETDATKALSDALFSLYTYLRYIDKIPDPAIKSPFYSPKQRYELRMKPFLEVTGCSVPPFEEFDEAMHPWGPYENPSLDVNDINIDFFEEIATAVKDAKNGFATVKKMGHKAAMCEGVEGWWNKNISGLLASCVAVGIAVATVKGKAGKGEASSLTVEVLEGANSKRYHDWWVVPKIS